MNKGFVLAVCAGFGAMGAAAEDTLTLSTTVKPAPDAVTEEIRAALDDNACVVSKGDEPVWEFWFVKQVRLPYAPDEGQSPLEAVKKTTLLGVVQLQSEQRDFKDNAIEKGVYTMRYATQPEDGNHLGTATYNYFVVLLPVSFDKTLETTMSHDDVVDESMASSITEHPMNLNLQPVKREEKLPVVAGGAEDSKVLMVELPAEADGTAVPLRFGIVVDGHGHIQ